MSSTRGAWSVAGLVAGFAGVAASYCLAAVVTVRDSPVVAVADLVIRLTPGPVAERAIGVLGHYDKPVLLLVIGLLLAVLFAWAGRLARRGWWPPAAVFAVLAVVGGVATLLQRGATALDLLPVVAGLVVWLFGLSVVTAPLTAPVRRRGAAAEGPDAVTALGTAPPGQTRRAFLVGAGAVAVAAAALAVVGRIAGRGRRHVEEARLLLRLPGVSLPTVPTGVDVGVRGIDPWQTPNEEFYRIDTAIVVPTVEPTDWRLRIHGLVDREIVLTYQDLAARRLTEAWVTLNCVSNEVGGDLIGNAWWSGVRVADLLREAGVREGADAVLQTSDDGWTCGTPLEALTDDRNAMLAVAMNGRPLPIEHGFPVRTIVPGLYGYVSACKWVVEMEVTRFADISAYWTERGWAERGPVKIASRIDVPGDGGELRAGGARVGGVAWEQHTGVEAVEIAVDGGAWRRAELARVPSIDTWVQWAATVDVEPGDHRLRVRAVGRDGQVQTGVEHGPVPDGATGWHTVEFTAVERET